MKSCEIFSVIDELSAFPSYLIHPSICFLASPFSGTLPPSVAIVFLVCTALLVTLEAVAGAATGVVLFFFSSGFLALVSFSALRLRVGVRRVVEVSSICGNVCSYFVFLLLFLFGHSHFLHVLCCSQVKSLPDLSLIHI